MAGRNIESGLYVAVDGNWGDAAGLTIIDDTDWKQDYYNWIDEATDGSKADLADAIDTWVKQGCPDLGEGEMPDLLLEKYANL